MKSGPVGILLAAGQGRRYGSNKLIDVVIDKQAMLFASAEKMAAVLPGSIVVISAALHDCRAELEQMHLRVVVNQQPEQGMGSSIACGVRASEDANGWFIMLADMPYIKTNTIAQLTARLNSPAKIIAPLLDQQRGHPVGFGADYKAGLLSLGGDVGARELIDRHRDQLELVPVDDAGVVADIDRSSDLL